MPDEQKQPTKKSRPPKAKSAYALALEKVQGEETSQPEEQLNAQTVNHLDPQPVEQKNSQPAQGDTTIQTAKQPTTETVDHQTIQTDRQTTSKTEKQQRTKATYYLGMEDIIGIDTIQTKRYRATGKKPEKSEIVSEAIQLLLKQENS